MATPYFDVTNEDHILLLPDTMRSVDDIESIAGRAERDVISMFIRRVSSSYPLLDQDNLVNATIGLGVYLLGYKLDAADPDVDPDLEVALRETIADVIEWRLRRRLKDPQIQSSSDDAGKTQTFRPETREDFPPDFDWRLQPFDARDPTWAI